MKFISSFLLILFIGLNNFFAQQISGPVIPGWYLKNQPVLYTADNLWDYIDGAADLFYRYEFKDLQVIYYTDSIGNYISLEIYKHSSPLYAFGVYSQERPDKTNIIKLGTEGYTEPGILNFIIANYYIKLNSNNSTEYTKNAMLLISRDIQLQIHENSSLPSTLRYFPEEGLIPYSESFIAKEFLGYDFFKEVFKANYSVNGHIFSIFIIERDTPKDAEDLLKNLYSSQNKKFKLSKNNMYDIKDKFNGEICLILKGRFLAGIIGLDDKKTRKDYCKKITDKIQL